MAWKGKRMSFNSSISFVWSVRLLRLEQKRAGSTLGIPQTRNNLRASTKPIFRVRASFGARFIGTSPFQGGPLVLVGLSRIAIFDPISVAA